MVLQLRYLLCSLTFCEKALFQNVAKDKIVPYHVRQRLDADFDRTWIAILYSYSRALCYKNIEYFQLQSYVSFNVSKFRCSLSR